MEFLAPPLDEAEYEACWRQIADESAFQGGFARPYDRGCKYVQLEAAVLTPEEARHLFHLAEGAWAIAQRLTAFGQQAPDALLDAMNFPAEFRPWFRSRPSTAPFSCLVRIDCAQDEEGHWHLLEYNAREPGGLPELEFMKRVHRLYRDLGFPVADPNGGLHSLLGAALRQALPEGPVGFCSEPGYGEDFENALAAAAAWDGEAVFGGWPAAAPDGSIRVRGVPVKGLYLYLPSEGLLDRPELLDRFAEGAVPVVNPGSALFVQDKRSLALAHQLCELERYWTPNEAAWIRRFVPYTSVVPFQGEWVAKPAFAREGLGVFFGEGPGPALPEYVYQARVHIRTHPLPVWTAAGPLITEMTPVVGVYLVNGRAAGFFTRVGGPITDQSARAVPTFVLES